MYVFNVYLYVSCTRVCILHLYVCMYCVCMYFLALAWNMSRHNPLNVIHSPAKDNKTQEGGGEVLDVHVWHVGRNHAVR